MKIPAVTQGLVPPTGTGISFTSDWTSYVRLHAWLVGRLVSTGCHKQDAEDAAQEALLKADQHLGLGIDLRHVRGWLVVVARNIVRDGRRRAFSSQAEGTMPGDLAEWEHCSSMVEENDNSHGVERAMGLLGPIFEAFKELRDRDRMILCAWSLSEGDSVRAASAMGTRQEEVKVLVFRARKRLNRSLMHQHKEAWGPGMRDSNRTLQRLLLSSSAQRFRSGEAQGRVTG